MNKINRFYKLILVFLFSDTLAQEHVLLNGFVNKSTYSFTIPFEYEKNMIIIRPEINGKKRKFVFDELDAKLEDDGIEIFNSFNDDTSEISENILDDEE